MSYVITLCRRCGFSAYFKEGQKTWKCPYCNHVNEADKCNVLSKVSTVKEAIALVQELKASRAKSAFEHFKRASTLT